MAKMVTLHRCGKEIAINADQIKWIEKHPSTEGTLIHFISGQPLDVDERPTPLAQRSMDIFEAEEAGAGLRLQQLVEQPNHRVNGFTKMLH